MWIILSDTIAQRRQSCLEGVTVLLFLNDAHCFSANHLRSWQIRFTQAETDVAGLRAIRDLTNRALLNAAQELWWLKLFQGNIVRHGLITGVPQAACQKRMNGSSNSGTILPSSREPARSLVRVMRNRPNSIARSGASKEM